MSTGTKQSLNKVTTGDLGTGGTMPRQMFEEFFQEVQDEARLLDMVRTVPIGRSKTRIPKIGVGERIRQAQAENTDVAEEGVTTDFVEIDAEKGSVYWSLTSETVEENPEREDLADTVLNLMGQQFAVDTQELSIIGDEADVNTFVNQNDGFLTLAAARGMPTYSHADANGNPQPIDESVFHNAIQTIEDRYLRTDPVFFLSRTQLQEFNYGLLDRSSPIGDGVLTGDADINPFGYDMVGIPSWPDDRAMFTDPRNLVYALRRDVEIDVLQQSDDIHDLDLFAKYAIRAKDDFQIEDENAGVLITDLTV